MNTNDHIRAVAFDLDGTLFDTLPSLTAAANEVLRHAGLRAVPQESLRAALSEGLRALFDTALALQPEQPSADDALALERQFLRCYEDRWLDQAVLYAGVSAMVGTLRERCLPLAICTNRDRESTAVLLAAAGLATSFDVVVGLGDAARPKPAPEPMLRVLDRFALPPAQLLFVGDSRLDARCAELSRVRFAAHLGGYSSRPDDLQPCEMPFTDYAALHDWVLQRLPAAKDACHA